MKNYKGYYIDGVIFHNEKEIDKHIKSELMNKYIQLCQLFATVNHSTEMAIACDEYAQRLNKEYGISWERLEEIEIEAYKTA